MIIKTENPSLEDIEYNFDEIRERADKSYDLSEKFKKICTKDYWNGRVEANLTSELIKECYNKYKLFIADKEDLYDQFLGHLVQGIWLSNQ